MTVIVILLLLAAAPIADARWLRVAQREHYLPGTVTTFATRWWRLDRRNRVLLAVALIAVAVSVVTGWAAVVAIEAAAIGPLGLSMRGRTSPLAWTRRLRVLAAVHVAVVVALLALGVLLGIGALTAGVMAMTLPLTLDVALAITRPFERRAASGFVDSAKQRLDRVAPVRVAITGSFGKTTIKGYVRHLVSGTRSVVASPASFNNTGGLSRAVNEHLQPDTEVFIAEMGTYGPGEIRDLCSWVRPDVSALCNIGPVHLERFGDLDTIVTSKSEIFETSSAAVVNIDAHGLATAADRVAETGQRVIRASATAGAPADVIALVAGEDEEAATSAKTHRSMRIIVEGIEHSADVASSAHPDNVAVSIGLALALDVPIESILPRLRDLPTASHRQEVSATPTGVNVIDDTYNSNPTGATAALQTLTELPARRRVLVTPGMVELGQLQHVENARFAASAAIAVDQIIIVGQTNRRALLEGAANGTAKVQTVATRTEAVEWVRANLTAGDAVLYENDLPDHFA